MSVGKILFLAARKPGENEEEYMAKVDAFIEKQEIESKRLAELHEKVYGKNAHRNR